MRTRRLSMNSLSGVSPFSLKRRFTPVLCESHRFLKRRFAPILKRRFAPILKRRFAPILKRRFAPILKRDALQFFERIRDWF